MMEEWIKEAKKNKCYALLIVMDTFDYECFPVEVQHKEDIINEQIKFNNHNAMLSLKETIIIDNKG